MAAPTNTPMTGEIWHLTIDDLLAPLPEVTRLGGPGPFVINLSASTAPITVPAKSIAGCEQAHMYQLQRTEDRRPRYRLRLGPFSSEDEADAVLMIVRDIYPGALTATADDDDLRAIATLRAKTGAVPPAPEKPAASIEKPAQSIEKPAQSTDKAAEKLSVAPVSLPPAAPAVSSRPAAKPTVSAAATAATVPVLSDTTASPAKPMAPARPTLTAAPTSPAKPMAPTIPTLTSAPPGPAK
ncbi:MAG TPA: SPOR domain-containing protein [Steroidobacteraceae bacterium]|nr:SPOR domain-containing protein [Steroidobacteraceae bacterium]